MGKSRVISLFNDATIYHAPLILPKGSLGERLGCLLKVAGGSGFGGWNWRGISMVYGVYKIGPTLGFL